MREGRKQQGEINSRRTQENLPDARSTAFQPQQEPREPAMRDQLCMERKGWIIYKIPNF